MSGKRRDKRNRPQYHTDERGHFVWENYFVRGKQLRSKRRVTVIDGEIVDDTDKWLLANADDVFLHQIERWDLIDQRMMDDSEMPQAASKTMKPPCKIKLRIIEIESVLERLADTSHIGFDDGPGFAFLDLTTGEVRWPDDEEEVEDWFGDENLLRLPEDLFEGLQWGLLDQFLETLPRDATRDRLAQVIQGKGAFRRFKDIVFGGGNVELKHRWLWFETRRKRECIVRWLRDENIEPEWDCDIFAEPPLPDKRADLLHAVRDFVKQARDLPGVRRIALIGSLTTPKAIPKDVDLLVEVNDDMPLAALARLTRQLSGKAMATGDGCGADVFLCDPAGQYRGRVCQWKQCAPGIRMSCQAQHCGRREYLSDDLQNVRLDENLVAAPPLELWPDIRARTEMPEDVKKELIASLAGV